MTQKELYYGVAGSPATTITAAYTVGTSTQIYVSDPTVLPAAPNRLTIEDTNNNFVTVDYTSITENTVVGGLTVIEGTPGKVFAIGSKVSRLWTAADWNDNIDNVADHEARILRNAEEATTSQKGQMSAADKTKLNGIEAGADVNTIEAVKLGGVALSPDAGKAVNIPLATTGSNGAMTSVDKTKLDGIAASADVNTIESVKVNGSALTPDSAKAVDIPLAAADKAGAMSSADKTKLNGIAAGADVNKIEIVRVNGSALAPDSSKAVNVICEPVITKKSAFNKDYGTAAPKAPAASGSVGTADSISRSDHVHPQQQSVGKLSTARKIDGVKFDGSADITHYAVCSTAAGIAAKTVSIASYALVTGSVAYIQFASGNTAASPTLNISDTGAKPIYTDTSDPAGPNDITAGTLYCAVYDGSHYLLMGGTGGAAVPQIIATSGANGSIVPVGTIQVLSGDSKTFSFQPNEGYKIKTLTVDGSAVQISKSTYQYVFDNIQEDHTISVEYEPTPIYTIRITRATSNPADAVEVSANSIGGDVSTLEKRMAIAQTMMRHCLLPLNLADPIYLNSTVNFAQDTAGNTVAIDGSETVNGYGTNLMLEIDQIWWTVEATSSVGTIKFSPYRFSPDAVCANLRNGSYREHTYMGVFEAVDITRGGTACMGSYNTSAAPRASTTHDVFYTSAAANGNAGNLEDNTYNMTMPLEWFVYQIMCVFVYKTRNFQGDVAAGYTNGASSLGAANLGFTATGGWTQGAPNNTSTGCMVLGVHNPYGNSWMFLAECIFNGGNLIYAKDTANHHLISGGSSGINDWISVPTGMPTNASNSFIKDVAFQPGAPFFPTVFSGASSSTYYCDACWSAGGDRCCFVGGCVSDAGSCGLFAAGVGNAVGSSAWAFGARLHAMSLE